MNLFKKLFNLSFFCFMGLIGFIYLGKSNGYAELLSHFAFVFFLMSIIYVAFYGYYHKVLFICCALIACSFTAYPWVHLYFPHQSVNNTKAGDVVSLLQFNVWFKNEDVGPLITYINENASTDIILIQEATPDIAQQLALLKTNYPYSFESPQWGAYGMVLYSKIPFSKADRIHFKDESNNYTIFEFKTPKNNIPFTLIEHHACSPVGDQSMTQRAHELEEVAKVINEVASEHKILIGDLNTTPYSPYFVKLIKDSRLKNSMQGLRTQGTWPSDFPSFLRIPLDHLLVSHKIHVVSQEVCPPLGSDHMPVLTKIKFAR